MKKLLLLLILISSMILSNHTLAQVPYFGTTAGDGKFYTYMQLKAFPGHNNQSFYASAQYGVLKNFDAAFNYNSGTNTNAWGVKYSFYKSKGFSIALQPMVAFDMKNNYKFSDVTTGLFMNGYFCPKFSYISNTWYTQTSNEASFEQHSMLGYDIGKVTALVGAVTNLSHNCKSDLMMGLFIPLPKSFCLYVWGGNLTTNLGDPKVTLGVDYKF